VAKIKIILDDGETQHDAEQALVKAINHHSSGDAHSSHSFADPALESTIHKMEDTFNKINKDMMEEIFQTLDEDYKNGY
jgi:DNA-binding MurR/RpiR family transcriptional regulator